MKHIKTEEFYDVVSKGNVLVDFFADWCGPCKMLGPILEKLDEEYPNVEFVKVNCDEEPEIPTKYNIMSIPTIYFFKDGKLVASTTGYRNEEATKAFIDEALKK